MGVNFAVLLATNTVLGVCLNFATLLFLQDIDNKFYELVKLGLFGETMEYMTTICEQISFPRRSGEDNHKFCNCLRISHLDTILLSVMFLWLPILLFFVKRSDFIDDDGKFLSHNNETWVFDPSDP